MKATGIVRRIDDLGRIVIPKEIRRVLKIATGDPLEIFTGDEGSITFKKYSVLNEMTDLAESFAFTVFDALRLTAVVADKEKVVAAFGNVRKELENKKINNDLVEIIRAGKNYFFKEGENKKRTVEGEEIFISSACPVISNGDVLGAIAVILPENSAPLSEDGKKLLAYSAKLLGKQLE